ncbi:MAG: DUF4136 domain-containing protein [Acidobacteria bacterium]|nr:DUF4136 domain-containing protein [Acidobacteriota bacterium]
MAKLPVVCVAILLLAGCNSTTAELPVRTEYDRATDFHDWENFRFASESGGSDHTRYPAFEKMVQEALEKELVARGYSRIEDGTPDFRVAFDLVFRGSKPPVVAPQGGGAEPSVQTQPSPRQRGAVTIKMLDPASGKILWTGQISEITMTSLEPQKDLGQAVWRILAEFPPITG